MTVKKIYINKNHLKYTMTGTIFMWDLGLLCVNKDYIGCFINYSVYKFSRQETLGYVGVEKLYLDPKLRIKLYPWPLKKSS